MPSRGFTLLEMAFVLAVIGVLLAAGMPASGRLLERQRLQAAADALAQDLRHARELALQSQQPVHLRFARHDDKIWCRGVSRGQPCDCSGASALPACNVSQVDSSDHAHVRLASAQDASFDPRLGSAPLNGRTVFATPDGQQWPVALSALGRAHSGIDSKAEGTR